MALRVFCCANQTASNAVIWFGRLIDSTGRIHGISIRRDFQTGREVTSQQEALEYFRREFPLAKFPNSRVEITGVGR